MNETGSLLQVVPKFLPKPDGIGDHAYRLAVRLREEFNVETTFLICDPSWEGPDQIEGFSLIHLKSRTSAEYLRTMQSLHQSAEKNPATLLHYACYGYEPRGCPFWLYEALKSFRSQSPSKLLVMYHELEARSWKPWSSVFWLPGLQRYILKRIGLLADGVVTNTVSYQHRLQKLGINTNGLLRSFSTIGEPEVNRPVQERNKSIVIFGRREHRINLYERHRQRLIEACSALDISTVIDIGKQIEDRSIDLGSKLKIEVHGMLDAAQVSSLFSESLASALAYPAGLLGKSSVYGAACAHGTISLLFEPVERAYEADPLPHISMYGERDRWPSITSSLQDLSDEVYASYSQWNSLAAARLIWEQLVKPRR